MMTSYEAVVVGASTGGLRALRTVASALPANFAAPVIAVLHISPSSDGYYVSYFQDSCRVRVKEADEKEQAVSGWLYLAPPDYHLLIEDDGTFSLSIGERVSFARPSIDVLFESAADAYCPGLIGVVLTGANSDGSSGLKKIKKYGGLAVVQDPGDAEEGFMPQAAISSTEVDYVLGLSEMGPLLKRLVGEKNGK